MGSAFGHRIDVIGRGQRVGDAGDSLVRTDLGLGDRWTGDKQRWRLAWILGVCRPFRDASRSQRLRRTARAGRNTVYGGSWVHDKLNLADEMKMKQAM